MKVRQSNFEFLRIIAMLMILVHHAMLPLYWREQNIVERVSTIPYIGMSSLFYLCFVAVNVFVLISGWFGIRPTLKGGCNFLFQIAFLTGLTAIVSYGINGSGSIIDAGLQMFALSDRLWFTKSYLLLFLISPVLNSFLDQTKEKQLRNFLVAYWGFIFIYGWAFHRSTEWLCRGYSPITFIGLYMLAGYMRRYLGENISIRLGRIAQFKLPLTKRTTFIAYFLPLVLLGSMAALLIKTTGTMKLFDYTLSYDSFFIVFTSAALLLFFSKLRLQNNLINKISASAFAVYILQDGPFMVGYYRSLSIYIFSHFSGGTCFLLYALMIVAVFSACVLIDQLRILVWRFIERKLFPIKQ